MYKRQEVAGWNDPGDGAVVFCPGVAGRQPVDGVPAVAVPAAGAVRRLRSDRLLDRAPYAESLEVGRHQDEVPVRSLRIHGQSVGAERNPRVGAGAVGRVVDRTIGDCLPVVAEEIDAGCPGLDRDRGEPLNKMSDLLDQFAAKMIPAGTVIYPEHIRAPILVRRGELVTVRCFLPGVLVRTVATAREDGAMGNQITVRNEKTRELFSVTVSGQGEAVAVDAARYKIGSDE